MKTEYKDQDIYIRFKERYMPHSVRRNVTNVPFEHLVKIYDLANHDIEWYWFEYEDGSFAPFPDSKQKKEN